ncbi:exopolyphosphatase / guanosine-5'-triphosphate,3'-diphosphate pyrophosphatase [Pelagirhabdus alkalitolerans]|uniref:Exopolyphosphatase / guanosine-5'-triphosphate,3'-diphosphate pyrophosphatase n=1 Tax=Pelagirhabdus alkalitolerans TaxID=1612202 RepID=A0A1G6IH07_9BACI|nr:Ppx/GppA family phosphatase [Pelagirhabdus alkalitolerans]SDC05690.1 exopolyphosphatase / guanosine-5'-triphosphate,3'-diphosphate pyrophosphatase [Pelagirhabdus alkalitolerans]
MNQAKNYYALIDIGSNTMRLVIYEQEASRRLKEVENVKVVARLRNHLNADNDLTERGQAILIDTLSDFSSVLNVYPLQQFTCIATAAIRQANNQTQLVKRVKDELGWDMRILSEAEEAYYGYLAVVNSTSINEGITVDMGGGSTEVTYFKNRDILFSHSFPFGTLTLDQLISDQDSKETNNQRIKDFVYEQFATLDWLKDRHVPIIGIGGSARNLAQIDQHDKAYPMAGLHQYEMNQDDILRVFHYLNPLSLKKRQKVEGLSKDRADIIIPAILTFNCLYEYTKATQFILSQKGLRDGVNYYFLLNNQQKPLFPNVLEDSMQELVNDYELNMRQISHVQSLGRMFFDTITRAEINDFSPNDWTLLKRASYVYNLGHYIDAESSAQHSFYLLANRTIDGLMHDEKLKVALVASFKNKTVFKQFIHPYKSWLTKTERKKLQHLGALLKFIYALDATKRQAIDSMDIVIEHKTIQITFYHTKTVTPEAYQIEKQKKHLEKALKRTIKYDFVKTSL